MDGFRVHVGKWPDALKDGKPNITMDTSNWRASTLTARTAVAISKDKKQVHLVTVDNRSGYSNGMSLTQFANYLAAQGYDRALNFDGGGSTAMGVRNHGSNTVVLANRTTNSRNVKYPRSLKQSVQHLSANRHILAYRVIKSVRCSSVQKLL